MKISLKPVTLGLDTDDTDGRLVFLDDRLVAVLSRLTELHGPMAGLWCIEAGFGIDHRGETFASLDAAVTWIEQRSEERDHDPGKDRSNEDRSNEVRSSEDKGNEDHGNQGREPN